MSDGAPRKHMLQPRTRDASSSATPHQCTLSAYEAWLGDAASRFPQSGQLSAVFSTRHPLAAAHVHHSQTYTKYLEPVLQKDSQFDAHVTRVSL